MTHDNLPPHLQSLGRQLDMAAADLGVGAHPSRLSNWARPRALAGGTLGLAGVAAAATLALSGGAAAPAFAVTRLHDGQTAVRLTHSASLAAVNHRLAAMGLQTMNRRTMDTANSASAVPNCASVPAGWKGEWEQETGSYSGAGFSVSETAPAGTWVLVDCYSGNPAYSQDGYTASYPNTSTTTTPTSGNTGNG